MRNEDLSTDEVEMLRTHARQSVEDADTSRLFNQVSLAVVYLGFGVTLMAFGWAQEDPFHFADFLSLFGWSNFTPSPGQVESSSIYQTPVAHILGGLFIFTGLVLPILAVLQSVYEKRAFRTALANQPLWFAPLLNYLGNVANLATKLGIVFSLPAMLLAGFDWQLRFPIAPAVWIVVSFLLPFFLFLVFLVYFMFRYYEQVAKGTAILQVKFRGRLYIYNQSGAILPHTSRLKRLYINSKDFLSNRAKELSNICQQLIMSLFRGAKWLVKGVRTGYRIVFSLICKVISKFRSRSRKVTNHQRSYR